MRRLLTAAWSLVLALSLGAGEASASIVFTLSGVTFDDGTSATGTFTTNDALTGLIDFDITTVDGAIPGFHHTPATADSSSTALPFILVVNTPPALEHILQLTFASGLTTAGAPITTNDAFGSFEQSPNGGDKRLVTAGSAVGPQAVPEPSTFALAAVGGLALAGYGWRRHRRA